MGGGGETKHKERKHMMETRITHLNRYDVQQIKIQKLLSLQERRDHIQKYANILSQWDGESRWITTTKGQQWCPENLLETIERHEGLDREIADLEADIAKFTW